MKIDDAQELIEFLSKNIYEKGNRSLCCKKDIDEYIKNVVSIIKFDNKYELSRIPIIITGVGATLYEPYRWFSEEEKERLINGFKKIGNSEIANLLRQLFDLLVDLMKPTLGNLDPYEVVKNMEYYDKLLKPVMEENHRKFLKFTELESDFHKLYDRNSIFNNVKNYIKMQRKDL